MNRTLIWGALILLTTFSNALGITIASGGEARAVVVVGAEATAPERHAAEELARFLGQATGGVFSIVPAAEARGPRVLVGAQAARMADAAFSTEGLGAEETVIRTVGDDLVLAGGSARGTLYAVYTFLEDQVGFRWWSPSVTHVPVRLDLRFDRLDTRYAPKLEYREPFWFSAFDGDWAVRNRCNGTTMRLDDVRGGKHVIEGFVHTFYALISPDQYFAAHPEWFSEIAGKRKFEQAQLCLTNEALRAELVKNLKGRLTKNPAATMASVSQNDCFGFCTCSACAAVDKEEGSQAGTMLRFVNEVARAVAADYPKVAISTLAYQYTRKPPLHVRPLPNVVVWLCSIECSFARPLTDPVNQTFRNDIEGWSKICNRLYVWDYTTNFRHYILPHPNLQVLGPNVKFFADHNVRGLFEQGAYHTWGAEMMELRAWVLAKMLWNPSLDAEKLTDEFMAGYYGAAAPKIRAYTTLMRESVIHTGDPLGCFSHSNAKFLSGPTLAAGWKLLTEAQTAAGADAALRERVQVAQLPLLYTFIVEWDRLQTQCREAAIDWPVAPTREAVYQQFMAVAEAIKVTHVAESHKIDWLKAQVAPVGPASKP